VSSGKPAIGESRKGMASAIAVSVFNFFIMNQSMSSITTLIVPQLLKIHAIFFTIFQGSGRCQFTSG